MSSSRGKQRRNGFFGGNKTRGSEAATRETLLNHHVNYGAIAKPQEQDREETKLTKDLRDLLLNDPQKFKVASVQEDHDMNIVIEFRSSHHEVAEDKWAKFFRFFTTARIIDLGSDNIPGNTYSISQSIGQRFYDYHSTLAPVVVEALSAPLVDSTPLEIEQEQAAPTRFCCC